MIPIVATLLGTLAENGLGLLSSAIQAKGKEVVENTLGVKIPDAPTPEDVAKLRQLQYDHEERLLELGVEKARLEQEELKALLAAAANEEDNVSKRWASDMTSDSPISAERRHVMKEEIYKDIHQLQVKVQLLEEREKIGKK